MARKTKTDSVPDVPTPDMPQDDNLPTEGDVEPESPDGSYPDDAPGQNINPFSDDFDPNLVGLPDAEDETFEEDFTDVQEFQMLPEGNYLLKCIDFGKSESKSGNPQYEWEFVVVGGEFDGRKKKVWASLVPAARWKVAAHLAAFGIEAAGSIARFKKSDMVGKMVLGEVKHEPDYKDATKLRDKIDSLFPYDGPGPESDLPDDPLDKFSDQ